MPCHALQVQLKMSSAWATRLWDLPELTVPEKITAEGLVSALPTNAERETIIANEPALAVATVKFMLRSCKCKACNGLLPTRKGPSVCSST